MTEKDAISYPYDWAHMNTPDEERQSNYWATHRPFLDPGRFNVDPNAIKPGDIYWRGAPQMPILLSDNPWANGHYALTAICWGAILMLLISVGVFP